MNYIIVLYENYMPIKPADFHSYVIKYGDFLSYVRYC